MSESAMTDEPVEPFGWIDDDLFDAAIRILGHPIREANDVWSVLIILCELRRQRDEGQG